MPVKAEYLDGSHVAGLMVDIQLTGPARMCLGMLETLHANGWPVENASSPCQVGRTGLVRIGADVTGPAPGSVLAPAEGDEQ